jgi:hypothetical protein
VHFPVDFLGIDRRSKSPTGYPQLVCSSFHVFDDRLFGCKQLSAQKMLLLSPGFTAPTVATTKLNL